MNVQQLVEQITDSLSVQRLFGEPYERNGVTVIPVANIRGSGGGGGGQGADDEGGGFGGGGGVSAQAAGAYVIKGDDVRWQPALDLNRVIQGAFVVAVVGTLAWRSVARAQLRARG